MRWKNAKDAGRENMNFIFPSFFFQFRLFRRRRRRRIIIMMMMKNIEISSSWSIEWQWSVYVCVYLSPCCLVLFKGATVFGF